MTNPELFTPDFSDFGPLEPFDAPFKAFSFAGLYALFDEDENCLYIGQSVSVPARIPQHNRKPWFSNVVSRRTLALDDEEARLIREAVLILSCKPRANRGVKLAKRADGAFYEVQFLPYKGSRKTR